MKYVVKMRTASGASETEILEAKDRAAVLSEMKKRGVTVLSINEAKEGDKISSRYRRSRDGSPPSPIRGVVAGLIIIAMMGFVAFLLLRGEKPAPAHVVKEKREAKTSLEFAPIHNVTNIVEKANPPKNAEPPPPQSVSYVGMKVTNAYGKVYTVKNDIKHKFLFRQDGVEFVDRDIFKHDSERMLDAILCCEPGDRLYATFKPAVFRTDLESALGDEIAFSDDDTDLERERKQAVIDAKKQLKEAMARGEDPVEIVINTRREIEKIADMRDNILNSLAEVRRTAETEEEVNIYIEAANKMLEPYGVRRIRTRAENKEAIHRAVMLKKLKEQEKNK